MTAFVFMLLLWIINHDSQDKCYDYFPVPPKEIIIKDSKGDRIQGVIGPYDEDEPLTLVCESIGGKKIFA